MTEREEDWESRAARFWAKVERTPDCWLWQGCCNKNGYGIVRGPDGKTYLAHRVAWMLTYGEIPAGLWVLHRCDVPRCVNPAHLWLGTQTDNMQDCAQKERNVAIRGENNWCARFTEDTVREIRTLYATGAWSQAQLTRRYCVSHESVRKVVRRITWKHI